MSEINELQDRIFELEKENEYLKSLLEHAAIPYNRNVSEQKVLPANTFDANQGNRIIPVQITPNHARIFFSYFWGRMDVFSKRYQNKTTGKAGYFPQCDNFWKTGVCPKASGIKIKCKDCSNRSWTRLEPFHIENHLIGKREDAGDVIGIYPLFPDGTCRFLVFDFDNHEKGAEEYDFANKDDAWIEEINALRDICQQNQIPTLVERSRSGRGAHIWIFFNSPVEASLARRFGFALLNKGAESVNLKTFHYYDRMLPAQDYIEDGEVGNLIALPLQGQSLKNGNSAFIDEKQNAIPDQWKALLSTKRLSKQQIETLMTGWNENSEFANSNTISVDDTKPWSRTNTFHKEDVSGKVKIVLSNQIYVSTETLSREFKIK